MSANLNFLIEQLPHKPPMRLIGEVLEANAGGASCRIHVDEALCDMYGQGESMDSYACTEIIAQTAAIALGSALAADGPQQSGMLIQVGKFQSYVSSVPKGADLRSEAHVELGVEGRVASVRGAVFLGDGRRVCEAKLTLAIGEA